MVNKKNRPRDTRIRKYNVHSVGIPEGQNGENQHEEIVLQNFPKLVKDKNS